MFAMGYILTPSSPLRQGLSNSAFCSQVSYFHCVLLALSMYVKYGTSVDCVVSTALIYPTQVFRCKVFFVLLSPLRQIPAYYHRLGFLTHTFVYTRYFSVALQRSSRLGRIIIGVCSSHITVRQNIHTHAHGR